MSRAGYQRRTIPHRLWQPNTAGWRNCERPFGERVEATRPTLQDHEDVERSDRGAEGAGCRALRDQGAAREAAVQPSPRSDTIRLYELEVGLLV